MCDVGYLCANFSLPRPLRSRLGPNVLDRQTDRRQTASSLISGGGIITTEAYWFLQTERIREFIHCTDCYLTQTASTTPRRRRPITQFGIHVPVDLWPASGPP